MLWTWRDSESLPQETGSEVNTRCSVRIQTVCPTSIRYATMDDINQIAKQCWSNKHVNGLASPERAREGGTIQIRGTALDPARKAHAHPSFTFPTPHCHRIWRTSIDIALTHFKAHCCLPMWLWLVFYLFSTLLFCPSLKELLLCCILTAILWSRLGLWSKITQGASWPSRNLKSGLSVPSLTL